MKGNIMTVKSKNNMFNVDERERFRKRKSKKYKNLCSIAIATLTVAGITVAHTAKADDISEAIPTITTTGQPVSTVTPENYTQPKGEVVYTDTTELDKALEAAKTAGIKTEAQTDTKVVYTEVEEAKAKAEIEKQAQEDAKKIQSILAIDTAKQVTETTNEVVTNSEQELGNAVHVEDVTLPAVDASSSASVTTYSEAVQNIGKENAAALVKYEKDVTAYEKAVAESSVVLPQHQTSQIVSENLNKQNDTIKIISAGKNGLAVNSAVLISETGEVKELAVKDGQVDYSFIPDTKTVTTTSGGRDILYLFTDYVKTLDYSLDMLDELLPTLGEEDRLAIAYSYYENIDNVAFGVGPSDYGWALPLTNDKAAIKKWISDLRILSKDNGLNVPGYGRSNLSTLAANNIGAASKEAPESGTGLYKENFNSILNKSVGTQTETLFADAIKDSSNTPIILYTKFGVDSISPTLLQWQKDNHVPLYMSVLTLNDSIGTWNGIEPDDNIGAYTVAAGGQPASGGMVRDIRDGTVFTTGSSSDGNLVYDKSTTEFFINNYPSNVVSTLTKNTVTTETTEIPLVYTLNISYSGNLTADTGTLTTTVTQHGNTLVEQSSQAHRKAITVSKPTVTLKKVKVQADNLNMVDDGVRQPITYRSTTLYHAGVTYVGDATQNVGYEMRNTLDNGDVVVTKGTKPSIRTITFEKVTVKDTTKASDYSEVTTKGVNGEETTNYIVDPITGTVSEKITITKRKVDEVTTIGTDVTKSKAYIAREDAKKALIAEVAKESTVKASVDYKEADKLQQELYNRELVDAKAVISDADATIAGIEKATSELVAARLDLNGDEKLAKALEDAKSELAAELSKESSVKSSVDYAHADKDKQDSYDTAVNTGKTIYANENAELKDIQDGLLSLKAATAGLDGEERVGDIAPEKHSTNSKGVIVDNQKVFSNDVLNYTIRLDYDQYLNMKVREATLQRGFGSIDDYPEGVLRVDLTKVTIVDSDGNTITGLTIRDNTSFESADEATKKIMANSEAFSAISGSFISVVADNPEEYFTTVVSKGKSVLITIPMTVKADEETVINNTAYQVDFGFAYKTNTVTNIITKSTSTGTVSVRYVEAGTGTVLRANVIDENEVTVGTTYDTTDHKLDEIVLENGKTYQIVPELTDGIEKGQVVSGNTVVTYVYKEVKADVLVNYIDEKGNVIKEQVKDVVQGSIGTLYDTTDYKLNYIVVGGVKYELIPEKTIGQETGKLSKNGIEVTYVYRKTTTSLEGGATENVKLPEDDEKSNVTVNTSAKVEERVETPIPTLKESSQSVQLQQSPTVQTDTMVSKSATLPSTGENSSVAVTALGFVALTGATGLAFKKRRK